MKIPEEITDAYEHLEEVLSKALKGDEPAIMHLYSEAVKIVGEKENNFRNGAKRGRRNVVMVLGMAMDIRQELINDLDEADWDLLIDEVVLRSAKYGIRDKRTVKRILDTNKRFIENPHIDEDRIVTKAPVNINDTYD